MTLEEIIAGNPDCTFDEKVSNWRGLRFVRFLDRRDAQYKRYVWLGECHCVTTIPVAPGAMTAFKVSLEGLAGQAA